MIEDIGQMSETEAMPPAAPAPAPGAAMPAEGEAVSPEEQGAYDAFVKQAMAIVYPPEEPGTARPQIIDNLKGVFDAQIMQMFQAAEPPIAETPQEALSVTTVTLVMMTEALMLQEGMEVPDSVVYHGGIEVLEILTEAAEAATGYDFTQEDIDNAALRAMDLYRLASPRADNDALKAEFDEIVAANDAGNLDQVLPGATQYAAQKGAPA